MVKHDPEQQRRFALTVVQNLRTAGFVAYWAGGCVRDQLLGAHPKDYDVATDATPDQVRELFGKRRTLAIGAVFGVISVLGPRGAGQIEVTTFRRDDSYSDGRRPDTVSFTSAEEDASRRDFTINGLFYDPLTEQVIDYVGGQADLAARLIRAIGAPRERFTEDKLRMLRAVRFAAALGFRVDDATREAIAAMAAEIAVVSGERIAMEMRRMLVAPGRALGVRLLVETRLSAQVLPELEPHEPQQAARVERAVAVLTALDRPSFPLALATLLGELDRSKREILAVAQRWRLSNVERQRAGWLIEHRHALEGAAERPWSQVQPTLVHEGAAELVAWLHARRTVDGGDLSDVEWGRQALGRPIEELDPPPLLTGDDLLQCGVPQGPAYRRLLAKIRAAQLDGRIQSRDQALALVGRLRRGEA